MKRSKKLTAKELAESFVFRNKLSNKSKLQEVDAIKEARQNLKKENDHPVSIKLKLLQSKYQMDDTPIKSMKKEELTIDKILKALLAKDSTQNVKIMFLDMMLTELGPRRPNMEEEVLKKFLDKLTKP